MTQKDGGSSARSAFFLLIPVLFLLGWFLLSSFDLSPSQTRAAGGGQTKFQGIPTQFIAALGDPGATSGSGAQSWGLWPLDPGPRGVELTSYQQLKDAEIKERGHSEFPGAWQSGAALAPHPSPLLP